MQGAGPEAQASLPAQQAQEQPETSAGPTGQQPGGTTPSPDGQAALALWLGQVPTAIPQIPRAPAGTASEVEPQTSTGRARRQPNEKTPPPDQTSLALWLAQVPTAIAPIPQPPAGTAPRSGAAERVALDESQPGAPASLPPPVEAQADRADTANVLRVELIAQVPSAGPEAAAIANPPITQPAVSAASPGQEASQKETAAPEARAGVSATAQTISQRSRIGDSVPPAAAKQDVEPSPHDRAATEDETKASKAPNSSAPASVEAASLPPLPIAPSQGESPAVRPREQERETPPDTAPAAPRPATENRVAVPAARSGETPPAAAVGELAFRARLVPLPPAARQVEQAEPFQLPRAAAAAPSASEAAPAVLRPQASDAAGDQPQLPAPRQPKAETRADVQPQPEGNTSAQPVALPAIHSDANPATLTERPSPAPGRIDTTRPAEPPQPPPAAEGRQSTLRDIRFEVNGPDRRVEVRLTERAGEVQVAVRTPDSRLAADLRENLPSLSSRLEQAGFRAEGLTHEAAPAAGTQRHDVQQMTESGAGDPGPGNREPGQRQGDPQQQPRPRTPEGVRDSKSKGKDFSWFLSTLT
jgi:hypothetical protein